MNALDNPAAEELILYHCRDRNGCMNSLSHCGSTAGTAKDGPLGWNLITRMAPQPATERVPCLHDTVIEECVCGLVVFNEGAGAGRNIRYHREP